MSPNIADLTPTPGADEMTNLVLAEARVPDRGRCHLAYCRMKLSPRRGIDMATGEPLGRSRWDYPESEYAVQNAWVIRYGLADGVATRGCDCTHALSEPEALRAWEAFLDRHPNPTAENSIVVG